MFTGTTICSIHSKIEDRANEILKLDVKNYDDVMDYEWEVNNLAEDILTLVKNALECGQNREDCIKERREAIESALEILNDSL